MSYVYNILAYHVLSGPVKIRVVAYDLDNAIALAEKAPAVVYSAGKKIVYPGATEIREITREEAPVHTYEDLKK